MDSGPSPQPQQMNESSFVKIFGGLGRSIEIILSNFFGLITFEFLYYLNFITAFVHLLSAMIILIMSLDLEPAIHPLKEGGNSVIGPYLAAVCYTGTNETSSNQTRPHFHTEPEQAFDLRIYFAVLVTIFFFLSAIFQAGQGFFKEDYKERVETNGVNYVRYIEYSLSASVMMIAIASSLMIWDIYTHILIFTCTLLCMMLGLVADFVRVLEYNITRHLTERQGYWSECLTDLARLKWFTHYLGWIGILSPYLLVFLIAYVRSVSRSSNCLQAVDDSVGNVPTFVHFLLFFQFYLFSSFGFVQVIQFAYDPMYMTLYPEPNGEDPYDKELKRVGIATEFCFVILSLIAKSILGWMIAANILFL